MRAAAALLAAAVAGCAVGPPLETRLAAWIGRGEDDLVAHFGVPARLHEAGGRRFLQFEERWSQIIAADPWWTTRPYGRHGPAWSPAPTYVLRSCDVTFALRQGVVESFSFRGDGCR